MARRRKRRPRVGHEPKVPMSIEDVHVQIDAIGRVMQSWDQIDFEGLDQTQAEDLIIRAKSYLQAQTMLIDRMLAIIEACPHCGEQFQAKLHEEGQVEG